MTFDPVDPLVRLTAPEFRERINAIKAVMTTVYWAQLRITHTVAFSLSLLHGSDFYCPDCPDFFLQHKVPSFVEQTLLMLITWNRCRQVFSSVCFFVLFIFLRFLFEGFILLIIE